MAESQRCQQDNTISKNAIAKPSKKQPRCALVNAFPNKSSAGNPPFQSPCWQTQSSWSKTRQTSLQPEFEEEAFKPSEPNTGMEEPHTFFCCQRLEPGPSQGRQHTNRSPHVLTPKLKGPNPKQKTHETTFYSGNQAEENVPENPNKILLAIFVHRLLGGSWALYCLLVWCGSWALHFARHGGWTVV